jgi:hypothetical protein
MRVGIGSSCPCTQRALSRSFRFTANDIEADLVAIIAASIGKRREHRRIIAESLHPTLTPPLNHSSHSTLH